ncbi:MAG: PPE family protein [Mycobacterium sp.]|uniref:PPE family protein n=1 Tax=Mycobacterium sp. TaxID=1785 RepID=UPI003CC62F68
MDYGALTPEVNSARMYTGAGSAPLLAAATAWNSLAAELSSAANSYQSVIDGLIDYGWQGSASESMAKAIAPYLTWMTTTAGQAEQTAGQANAAAGAYDAAFAATVPPAEIAVNRTQLSQLVATNILGQNASAIAAVEAQYGEMWAQDAAAMYGYAANSAAAAKVSQFSSPAPTTSTNGLVNQSLAATQSAGSSSSSGVQNTLSQLVSAFPNALQNLASPAASGTSGSGLSGLLGGSGIFGPGTNNAATGFAGFLNAIDGANNSAGGTFLNSSLTNGFVSGGYLNPALVSPAATSAIADINSLKYGAGLPALGGLPDGLPLGGGGGIPALSSAPAAGLASGPAVSAGIGNARLVGGLSAPQSWAPANQMTTPISSGAMEFHTVGMNAAEQAAGMPGMPGMPMMGGGSRSFSFATPRYGFRPTVMAQPPAAG